MTTQSHPSSSPLPVRRSLGLKLIVILVLIVLMAIPIMFISFISFERSSRADEVTREVSQTYGGEQRLLGPVLTIPYRESLGNGAIREGDYIVSALSGDLTFENITVEEKSRSLYKVPVYAASARFRATLPSLDELPSQTGISFDLEQARIVVGLGDVTGLQSDVTLSANGNMSVFEPYQEGLSYRGPVSDVEIAVESARNRSLEPAIIYDHLQGAGLTLLSVNAADVLRDAETQVEVLLDFTGARSLSVTPFAKSTSVAMASDWPHPGFEGQFPPTSRDIQTDGFTATWSVPFLRRGLIAEGRAQTMNALFYSGPGQIQVNFVSPLNPYQTVNRALKYAVLFIGLVFLAYFLMETLLSVRVHPAQYLLIGIAQAVFYLLLLAFSEHIGFVAAFAISALATVVLTAGYAGAVFGRDMILKSALVFGTVYGLLFVLMRIQDFALMVGALVSFLAIAATLYLTRNMDWYGNS